MSRIDEIEEEWKDLNDDVDVPWLIDKLRIAIEALERLGKCSCADWCDRCAARQKEALKKIKDE